MIKINYNKNNKIIIILLNNYNKILINYSKNK